MAHSPTLESLKLILKLLGQAELKGLESVLPPAACVFRLLSPLLLGTSCILSLDGHSFPVSLTSALTSLSNVWTGLDLIEPTGHSSYLSKLVMSLCMAIGRLELFPIWSFSAVRLGRHI